MKINLGKDPHTNISKFRGLVASSKIEIINTAFSVIQ